MSYAIYQTTAEEIIGATDAVLQVGHEATEQFISDFLTTSLPNGGNAANMAVELGLLAKNASTNQYSPKFPYAVYLVTSNSMQKAALLRFVLEEYVPYKAFKSRLKITNSSTEAANQVKAIFNLTAHKSEINQTFISLGTFSNSLTTEGAGKYSPSVSNSYSFIKVINEVVQDRQEAELKIRERLGEEIFQWISNEDVFVPMVTGFQRAAETQNDERAPILHAGNAIESYLSQVGNDLGVNLNGATGINAKIERITQAGYLTVKHKNICKYLGHIRNACDHGIDTDIGQTWTISPETGVEYVHIALTAIRSIYDCMHGNYIL